MRRRVIAEPPTNSVVAARVVPQSPAALAVWAGSESPAASAVSENPADRAVRVAVAAVAGEAEDEQFTNGTTTYEIEIQHHEAIKNFFGRLCDRLARFGRVCVAGRVRENQAGCDGRFSVQTKTIQHTERGDRQP